jgi:S-formylglutathione hydrolase FrmB
MSSGRTAASRLGGLAAGVLVTSPVVGVLLLLQRHVTASLAGNRTPARSRAATRRGAGGGATTWRRRHPAGPPRRPLVALLAMVVLALVLGSSLPAPAPGARADDGARIVAVETIDRRTVDLTIDSPALGRTGKARLLLPDRFAAEPARRWPLLYLLHGCCDSYVSWTRSTDVEQLTEDAGVLVVMPEAGRAGFYSDWYNGGRGGPPRWETFHLVELRQLLERNYRAGGRRAVAGLSMGGLGATAYAARHPGMFRAVASFSGILDTWPDDASLVLGLLRSFGDDPLALWGDPDRQAAVWREHDPAELASGLRGTALFVGFGDGRPGPFDGPDAAGTSQSMLEARLHAQNERFAARLRALRIPARVDDYGPGIHDWPYWQRELHRAWPMLLRSLGA